MNKVSKHLLILRKRINQRAELKKLSQIRNEMLQNVVKAFETTQKNTHHKDDLRSFENCEGYRTKLLADHTVITYEVFSSENEAIVSDICKKATSTQKWCQFLYHIVKNTASSNVLEIGTNLGVSGSYILEAMKNNSGKFTTMEGLPQLCEIAEKQFLTIVSESQFEIIQGLYNQTFQRVIESDESYNLIFIDGNHKKEATIEYFIALKSKVNQSAIFIFDDIYWSKGMEEAWKIIKEDEDIIFSLDLYEQGIIIIDKNDKRDKEHFDLHLSF